MTELHQILQNLQLCVSVFPSIAGSAYRSFLILLALRICICSYCWSSLFFFEYIRSLLMWLTDFVVIVFLVPNFKSLSNFRSVHNTPMERCLNFSIVLVLPNINCDTLSNMRFWRRCTIEVYYRVICHE